VEATDRRDGTAKGFLPRSAVSRYSFVPNDFSQATRQGPVRAAGLVSPIGGLGLDLTWK